MSEGKYLVNDAQHTDDCHYRWYERRNKKIEENWHCDQWYYEQCLRCAYYIPLTGILESDWGACTNPRSAFDGNVRFEHDGCEQFTDGEADEPPEEEG